MLRPISFVAVVLCAAALVVSACSRDEIANLKPPPTFADTTTTAAVDLSQVNLAGVPGRMTTTVQIGPGGATLAGAVIGPEGPVPGAVVHAERLVGDGIAAADVVTQPDGRWVMPGILGGRYRVRAWRAPDLALTNPEVFFLEGAQTKTLDLTVNRFQGVSVSAAIAPSPPIIDEPASLVVQVNERAVDDAGIVRGRPVSGAKAELVGSGDWRVLTANPATTDGAGRVRWQVLCRRAGTQPMSVVVADAQSFPLQLPACTVAPPPLADGEPVEPPDDEPTSTTTRDSTTTTARSGTTSTTRRQ